MANIRVDLDYTIKDGVDIVFNAPCDGFEVTGLIIYYPSVDNTEIISKTFTFKDAHNNNIGGLNNLFKSGARIKVNLDFSNNGAYIYNADTNKYLEDKFDEINNRLTNIEKIPVTLASGNYADNTHYVSKRELGKLLFIRKSDINTSELNIKLPFCNDGDIGKRIIIHTVDCNCTIKATSGFIENNFSINITAGDTVTLIFAGYTNAGNEYWIAIK